MHLFDLPADVKKYIASFFEITWQRFVWLDPTFNATPEEYITVFGCPQSTLYGIETRLISRLHSIYDKPSLIIIDPESTYHGWHWQDLLHRTTGPALLITGGGLPKQWFIYDYKVVPRKPTRGRYLMDDLCDEVFQLGKEITKIRIQIAYYPKALARKNSGRDVLSLCLKKYRMIKKLNDILRRIERIFGRIEY